MKKSRFLLLAALLLPLLSTSKLFSADAISAGPGADLAATNNPADPVNADIDNLVTKINAKLKAGKNTEADLADNIKEFDALFAKYKDAKPDDRAEILLRKAALYLQVLNLPEKALPIFKQMQTEFPTVQIDGSTEKIIATVQRMADSKAIHDALAPGTTFPDFHETDVQGKPLSISQYKGKVVLVDFWATWCPPCVAELPEIQKAYKTYHDQGFEVVGISLDEDKSQLERFVKQRNMPWPEYYDGKRWDNKLAVKYGVDQTPTGYLLDRNGKIITKIASPDELEPAIAKAVKN